MDFVKNSESNSSRAIVSMFLKIYIYVFFFNALTLMDGLHQYFMQNQTSNALDTWSFKWLKTSLFGNRSEYSHNSRIVIGITISKIMISSTLNFLVFFFF